MCEHKMTMNRRRNALADIFEGLSQEKIDQLQRFINTDSGFEDESSPADVIDPTATSNPTKINSTNLNNRCIIDQSNPIDIIAQRHTSLNLGFRDIGSSHEDAVSDEEDDERFVQFVNSPRYHQRRFGVVENVFLFCENANMLVASH